MFIMNYIFACSVKYKKEVIETTLFEKYNLQVTFSSTRVVCIEKPIGIGNSVEVMGEKANPFYATVGFKVERGELNSGITYTLGVELGSLPLAFHKAIEDTVFQTLKQGLYGWEVTGYFCHVNAYRLC